LFGLILGIESGNPTILREVQKPGTVDVFLKAAEVLHRHEKIHARGFLMAGFPNETYRQVLDTIDLAFDMQLDWYNVAPLQPLPNTPIFDSMLKQGLIDSVNFRDVALYSGPYNKAVHRAKNSGRDLLSKDFKNAFSVPDLDAVLDKKDIDAIWGYMHFHLNFNRLFQEQKPVKLLQQLEYIENITDLIVPENAFAMYFAGYLQKRVNGCVTSRTVERLEKRLTKSDYWQQRFDEYGLKLQHLITEDFSGKQSAVYAKSKVQRPREVRRIY
jgi:hypothetical protein